jgi:hypothetical protein
MTVLQRIPHRITITISDHVYQRLLVSSDVQGRSLSNLAAFLLENALGATGLQGREQPLAMFRR